MGLQFTKRELDKYKRLARSDKFKADIKKQNLNIIKEKSNQFNKIEAKDLQTKELEKVILDNGIKKMPNTKFKKIRRGIYTNPNTNEIKDIISKPKDCIIREEQAHKKTTYEEINNSSNTKEKKSSPISLDYSHFLKHLDKVGNDQEKIDKLKEMEDYVVSLSWKVSSKFDELYSNSKKKFEEQEKKLEELEIELQKKKLQQKKIELLLECDKKKFEEAIKKKLLAFTLDKKKFEHSIKTVPQRLFDDIKEWQEDNQETRHYTNIDLEDKIIDEQGKTTYKQTMNEIITATIITKRVEDQEKKLNEFGLTATDMLESIAIDLGPEVVDLFKDYMVYEDNSIHNFLASRGVPQVYVDTHRHTFDKWQRAKATLQTQSIVNANREVWEEPDYKAEAKATLLKALRLRTRVIQTVADKLVREATEMSMRDLALAFGMSNELIKTEDNSSLNEIREELETIKNEQENRTRETKVLKVRRIGE